MKLLWCALTIVGFCAHLSALASLASHHNSLSSEFSHDAPNISQSSEEFKRTGLQRGAIPLREELMDPSRGLRTDCSHLNQGVLNIRPAGQKRPARVFNLAGLMDEFWNFFFLHFSSKNKYELCFTFQEIFPICRLHVSGLRKEHSVF